MNNTCHVSQSLISVGRLFQVRAALTKKDDCPNAFLLTGIIQSPLVTDLLSHQLFSVL